MNGMLSRLIKFKQNEFVIMRSRGDADINDEMVLGELIIEVCRIVNNIRYCTNKSCHCSPERQAAYWYKEFKKFIKRAGVSTSYLSMERLEELVREYSKE